MGYKPRKGSNGRSKLHAVKQHRSPKNHASLSPCIHRCVGGESELLARTNEHSKHRSADWRRVRNYIMKALDFGVESGYLVPTDRSYRMLRVSSDLLNKHKRKRTPSKARKHRSKACVESWCSREGDKYEELDDDNRSPTRFEEYPVQDAKRKRRRSSRKRSRSRSRRRRSSRRSTRKRKGEENPEEAGEDDEDEDYEIDENAGKKTICTEHTSNDSKSTRSKTQDTGKTNAQGNDDISDVSVDEDDTDEEEDKKEANNTKS
ncbi:hypothetical protein KPH14_007713 [Odynerus spinipes]|uniref:Uncharacterized protein n=1 Tax=Odynerus spinipes TaxID=1348599 RepID=A0AAD9VMU7_9HYME|nr:hypothetical protein KPH14_007713 [Odynerus spinipes]